MLGNLISQDMFGYRENKRKWRKVENYIERRSLKSSTIRKSIPKSPNESIAFLFIGQGQEDTWHHLRGLLDASSSRNLERIHFRTSFSNFAWWCEVENPSFSSFWSVWHDCAKISHGHVKSLFTFPLYAATKPILFHFAWLCENFAWSCEIEKHVFPTPLCNFSHFFIFNPPSPPSIKLQSLVQMHFLFLIIHIVYPPPFHFPLVTPCFKNHLKISPKLNKKPLVSLARVAMYYLGILGIITTQKVWNSWKLVSKMCGFWVVIISLNQHIASPLTMV